MINTNKIINKAINKALILSILYLQLTLMSFANDYSRELMIKLKSMPSNNIIGSNDTAYINGYELKKLTKYNLKINSQAGYDLSVINQGKMQYLRSFTLPILLKANNDQGLFFDEYWYRGDIYISESNQGHIAVNYVDIEYVISSILGQLADQSSSRECIKAAAVLLRTSLACLKYQQSPDLAYDIYMKDLDYIGMASEKATINELLDKTKDEILISENGKLICSKLRSSLVPKSIPFEYLGYKYNAWEKTMSFEELKNILNRQENYNIEDIVNISRQIIGERSEIQIIITTTQEPIILSPRQAQDLLGLPSEYFKIYAYDIAKPSNISASINSSNSPNSNIQAQKHYIQFLGTLAGYDQIAQQYNPLYNIIDSLEEMREFSGEDYYSILQNLYPHSYITKI